MLKKNILILCGGGGSEHDVSLVSANYLEDKLLSLNEYNIYYFILTKDFKFIDKSKKQYHLDDQKCLIGHGEKIKIDFAIPCIHGIPGETGDIQSYFELIQLPYLGACQKHQKFVLQNNNKAMVRKNGDRYHTVYLPKLS